LDLLTLATALVAGFAHAIAPDHVAAVTTFVSRRPRAREAAGFGLRWGMGHSAAILVLGSVLIALDLRVSGRLAAGLEFGVGAMLLCLGLWLLWSVVHEQAHRVAGNAAPARPHSHATAWVGVAHGLAGTAPLVAALAATTSGSAGAAVAYLLLFGVGTTAAMALYALAAGLLFGRAGRRGPRVAGALRAATALGSAAIGVVWMLNAAAAA